MTGTAEAPRSLPWITRLMAMDTTSRYSNMPLVDVVAAYLRDVGLEPHVRPEATGERANLVVTIADRHGGHDGGIVLSGHTDVVPVDGQDWSSDPFAPEIRGERLYGRGACDMKGFLGVVLAAVPDLLAADLAEPVHLAFSYDEEVGCVGGEQIVRDIADLGLRPRLCVVGEPSTMRVVTGHKAITLLHAQVTGLAAHSSLTTAGVNAIEHAARLVRWVRERADDWRVHGPYDHAYEIPYTTASVNQIVGGNGVNIVPATCALDFEFRSIAAVDPADVVADARAFAADIEGRMRAEDPAAAVSLQVASSAPGLDTDPAGPAVAFASRLGVDVTPDKVTYATEAGLFQGAGIETVVCGPGDIAQAHRPDEYIELHQIRRCEQFLDALVRELSGA